MKILNFYSIKRILAFTRGLPLLLLISCQSGDDKTIDQGELIPAEDFTEAKIYNLENIPLRISFSGDMIPWKQAQLMVPFQSKIISSLAEPTMNVNKNDVLVSLWKYSQQYEYTPLNLIAPFNGFITNYSFKVGDEIPENQPILTIKNYDYYTISISMHEAQKTLIKKWAKVYFKMSGQKLEGYIFNIIHQHSEAVIRVSGEGLPRIESAEVRGYVEVGNVSGTFILNHHFNNQQEIPVIVDPNIEITLTRIGVSDSLALVFPEIPDQEIVSFDFNELYE